MRTKELMVGDWYQWYAEGKYYPYQMTKDMFAHDDATISNFEPIPLTAEILEKNDFAFEDSGDWIRYDGVNSPYQQYISIRFHRDLTVRHVEIKGMRYHCNYDGIRYVHELQRALRCCGLCDLANNFTI